jgi:hypothetical protein
VVEPKEEYILMIPCSISTCDSTKLIETVNQVHLMMGGLIKIALRMMRRKPL